MSIQIDNGDFTRIHNDILGGLAKAHLTALEFRCLLFLVRMTYGWQKKEDKISLSQWAAGIGIDKSNRGNMLNTLNGLVAKGVIYTRSNGNNRPATWGLNKSYFDNETVMQPHNSTKDELLCNHITEVLCEDITDVPKTVMQPHNHKRKVLKKELKKEEEGAATQLKPAQNLAISAFQDVWRRYPSKPQMDTIIARVVDVDLWREACQAWANKGHKPTNVEGMLDFYDHPERFRTAYRPASGGDYANGRSTNNGVNAIMDYIQDRGLGK